MYSGLVCTGLTVCVDVQNEGYGFRSDVWGLGCLLYEMVMLRSPFETAKTNFYILGKMVRVVVGRAKSML